MNDGHPERVIDFPIGNVRWRGCDEAWRCQLAIDSLRGSPQRYRIKSSGDAKVAIELFSPLPAWVRRRWNAIGRTVSVSGNLFAYEFSTIELEEELRFARDTLWLRDMGASASS